MKNFTELLEEKWSDAKRSGSSARMESIGDILIDTIRRQDAAIKRLEESIAKKN